MRKLLTKIWIISLIKRIKFRIKKKLFNSSYFLGLTKGYIPIMHHENFLYRERNKDLEQEGYGGIRLNQ